MPSRLLLETSGYLLLESGDKLLLESSEAGTSASSSISAYTQAPGGGNSTIHAYLCGQSSQSNNSNAYTKGQISSTTTKTSYVSGISGILDTQSAYTIGRSSATDSQNTYTKGSSLSISNKDAYIKGNLGASDSILVYTKGNNISSTSHGSYLFGATGVSTSSHAYVQGKLKSYAIKIGSFNIDINKTIGQTQSITGVDFTPKIVLFWWSGFNQVGDAYFVDDNLNFGFGAAIDSTHRFGMVAYSENNLSISNTYRSQSNTEIMRAYIPTTPSVDGILDFYSMDSDGFTVIIDDQFSKAYRINYIALGGNDLTDVYIGSKTLPTTTGNFDVTDVGFSPDAILTFTQMLTSAVQESSHALLSMGWAANNNQGVVSYFGKDNVTTTLTRHYGYNNEIYASIGTGATVDERGRFVSFLSNGFRLNHLEGTNGSLLYYIALKGGQYVVGETTAIDTYGDVVETGVGFKPAAALFWSANSPINTQDTATAEGMLSFGGATSPENQAVQSMWDDDNWPSSAVGVGAFNDADYTSVYYGTIMELKSFDNDGFTNTMRWTQWESGTWITYLAFGLLTTTKISAYTEGRDTSPKSSNPAFTQGIVEVITNISAYLNGKVFIISNVPAYVTGLSSITTFKNAYLTGRITTTSSQSAFIQGEVIYSIHAYLYGRSDNESTINAYVEGTGFIYGPLIWTT